MARAATSWRPRSVAAPPGAAAPDPAAAGRAASLAPRDPRAARARPRPTCAPLAERFAAAGHRLYLVGGIVRDLLLGRDLRPDARPRPDHRRPARPRSRRSLDGWADAVWTQGERFGTIGAEGRHGDLRDHHPPGRGLPGRLAASPTSVFADDSRGRPVPPRLHRQRHGAASCPSLELIDPFGGAADLARRASCARRSSPEVSFSDDPLRMLRAARFIAGYGLEPAPELVAAVRDLRRPAGDRVGRAHPRRARQAAWWSTTRPPGCGSSSTPAWPTSSCPSCRRCASSRTRSTATRTCWPTRSRWWPRRRPERIAAARGAVPRRRQAQDPRHRRRGASRSTTTRWSGARMTRGPACRRCATPTTTSRPSRRLVFLHLRFHTYQDGLDRLGRAPLRPRRRRRC